MNADERGYKHEDVTRAVIGAFFEVYNEMGYGFLEAVYREAMVIALQSAGLSLQKEVALCARFRGHVVGEFRADLLIAGKVIVELKAVKALEPVHEAQVLNYLRTSALEVALLLNFGPKPQIQRLAYSNSRKSSLIPANVNPRSSAFICG